jgi:hypothetical protein
MLSAKLSRASRTVVSRPLPPSVGVNLLQKNQPATPHNTADFLQVQKSQLTRNFTSTPVSNEKTFGKILIANRGLHLTPAWSILPRLFFCNSRYPHSTGEITCRVIDTAKKMGIKTVSVFSDPGIPFSFLSFLSQASH